MFCEEELSHLLPPLPLLSFAFEGHHVLFSSECYQLLSSHFFSMLTPFQVRSASACSGGLLSPLLFGTDVSGMPCTVCAPSLESDIFPRFLSVRILRRQGLDASYTHCCWAVTASVSSLVRSITHTYSRTHTHTCGFCLYLRDTCVDTYTHDANLTLQDFSYISYFTLTFLLQ